MMKRRAQGVGFLRPVEAAGDSSLFFLGEVSSHFQDRKELLEMYLIAVRDAVKCMCYRAR